MEPGAIQDIGEYLAALSNSAALEGKPHGYLIWGIADHDHSIIGTAFDPRTLRQGAEELENWLLRGLNPQIHFRFHDVLIRGRKVVVLEVDSASHRPTQFRGNTFIRVGSYKKYLRDYPSKEQALWRVLDSTPFEDGIAAERASSDDLLGVLDYGKFFELLDKRASSEPGRVAEAMLEEKLISRCDAGGWNITNLGAILFGKRIEDFPPLSRKAVRVIQYRGADRTETIKERVGSLGYAAGFEGLISYINGMLPSNEVIGQALRRTLPLYPELAIRELVANALIHQDFHVRGTGPMIEVFEGRIEITNPGVPLVDTDRFLDLQPRSRNESLAFLMRRLGICEERGSGIDKVIKLVEISQLPPPLFEAHVDSTRSVLFAHRPLGKMDRAERVRALYQHSCLRYVNREQVTNTTVRQRFGIGASNKATASKLIREAIAGKVIKLAEEGVADKFRSYLPFWA